MEVKTLQFPIILSPNNDEEQSQEISRNPKLQTPTDIHCLPDPLLEEILSRVPAKTVFGCKIVSKPWLSVVDDPIFAKTHFSRAPICPLLVFSDKSGRESTRIMHLVEGQTVSDLDPRINECKLVSRMDFSDLVKSHSRKKRCYFLSVNANATSCEGVVCWASNGNRGGDHIFICNPITAEYVTLDPTPNEQQDDVYVFIGIGFVRETKKYEVLRMSRRRARNKVQVNEFSRWWPEVLTVGSAVSWRRVGDGTSRLDLSREISDVVYVNGAIYWWYNGDSSICSFNFDRVLFEVIPLPQMNLFRIETKKFAPKNITLGVLGNSLCVSMVCPEDGHVELWVLENYRADQVPWIKVYDVETETTYLEHSGMLGTRGQYKAIKYLECGGVLMHDWRETFLIYDPITKTDRQFRVLERFEEVRSTLHLQVVPHVPCLVKLKNVLNMEDESVMVLKAYPRVN